MERIEREYILAFSSFYRAAYGQDVLAESGIKTSLKKLPTELVKSCGTGLYLRADSVRETLDVLDRKGIAVSGVYEIKRPGSGERVYERLH